MKKWRPQSFRGAGERPALRGGAYALALSAVVLAILIVVNVLAGALPASLTKRDISAAKLYSITSNTKVVVNALDREVTIYWIVQSGQEDQVIENLLDKYDSLSERIQVIKKDPDVFPTFAQQYTSKTVRNNSLIVECGERSRYIGYDDIYLQEADLSTYSYNTSFDGEGAVTSAIDYVVREELPQLYLLEGHGEGELPDSFREQIEKENMETNALSLLTVDEVPEEADCVVIYAPERDISEKGAEMLSDYVSGGGRLLVMAGPAEDDALENLYNLLSAYGVQSQDGVVVEGDRERYAFQAPFALLPDLNSHAVTDPLTEEGYQPILPIARGLTVAETLGGVTVSELLTTSDASFSKADGYGLTTYEKEEGDADGPFALAVSVELAAGGKLVWFSSSQFVEDMYNAYSSGANLDLAMNALSSLVGENEAVAIRSKPLNYNYLTISDSAASVLKVLLIGAFPLAYLGYGVCVVWKRRRLQNEPV